MSISKKTAKCKVLNEVIEVFIHADLENGMFLVSKSAEKQGLFKVNKENLQ